MKVLFGMALRQTTGFVESLVRLIGLDWAVPDFSTLSRRQKTLKVNIPYRGSNGPLHLLVDSTGIKVEGEGEWNARKHGGTKRRVWRKIHIGIDEKTLEIRATEFTTSDVGDAPMLSELLGQIPPEQKTAAVTADGAFDTRKCHDAIAARGAAAIIPPRKNAKPWKPDTPGAGARNEILRSSKRVGRTIWRRWSGYHRRSRAETKMHCVKPLGSAYQRGTSTVRSRSSRSGSPCSTASPRSASPSQRSRDRSAGERGRPVSSRFVQQSPTKARMNGD